MKLIRFSEVKNGERFILGKKSICIKGSLGNSKGAWCGKHLNNWKFIADDKIVTVERNDSSN